MKQKILLTGLLLFLFGGVLFAQTGLTIGANYWHPTVSIVDIDTKEEIELGSGSLYGPYLNLRSGKWNFGGSLFLGSMDFKDYDIKLNRTDINVQIGYNIIKGIVLFGAMKNTTTKVEYKGWDFSYDDKINLFGGGISASIPLTRTSDLFIYGSFAYLAGQEEAENYFGGTDKTDVALASLTFGLGYRLAPQAYILGGYRSDAVANSEADNTAEAYRGLILTIGFAVR